MHLSTETNTTDVCNKINLNTICCRQIRICICKIDQISNWVRGGKQNEMKIQNGGEYGKQENNGMMMEIR